MEMNTGDISERAGPSRWSRKSAFLVHLLGSAGVVGLLALVVFFHWYPHPYYLTEDSLIPLRILVGVDVVLGPLMTLILFRPGKRGLKFDMSVILLVQVLALGYGTWVIHRERPVYLPFAVDHFVVVASSQVDTATLGDPALEPGGRVGPLPVFARLPTDAAERSELVMQALGGGKDVERLPQYYRPLAQHLEELRAKGLTLTELLKKRPEARAGVEGILARRGVAAEGVRAYYLDGGIRDMTLLVNVTDGTILGAVDVLPL